jgi:diguanylate cyclase (GGDEF)-like protein
MTRRAWFWWLVLGTAAAMVYPRLEFGTAVASLCYDGFSVLTCVAMAVGIRRHRPPEPLLWWLLFAGTATSVAGDLTYDYLANVAHVDAYPSLADVLYLASYPLTLAGLAVLIRRLRKGRDRSGLIDAAIVACALALPMWVFLINPLAGRAHAGLGDQLVTLAYPILDVFLIAATARLATIPGLPRAALFLVAAQVVRLPPDVFFAAAGLTSLDFPWFEGGWLLTYALTAVAVLHPSAGRVTAAGPGAGAGGALSTPRLTLLAAASLLGPAVLVVQGLTNPAAIDWQAVASNSTILFLLVVYRMKLLLNRLHRQAVQLDDLAHLDGLTGVPNRRSWDETLDRELARARRSGEPVVVGLIDLDLFKRFNDAYGHQAGDLLLKEAAAAWRARLREADVLARYGGEEFGVVIAGRPAEEALEIVSRLRAITPRDQTFSAGLAEWDRDETADDLVRRADEALYQAKEAGRNRVFLAKSVTLAG